MVVLLRQEREWLRWKCRSLRCAARPQCAGQPRVGLETQRKTQQEAATCRLKKGHEERRNGDWQKGLLGLLGLAPRSGARSKEGTLAATPHVSLSLRAAFEVEDRSEKEECFRSLKCWLVSLRVSARTGAFVR